MEVPALPSVVVLEHQIAAGFGRVSDADYDPIGDGVDRAELGGHQIDAKVASAVAFERSIGLLEPRQRRILGKLEVERRSIGCPGSSGKLAQKGRTGYDCQKLSAADRRRGQYNLCGRWQKSRNPNEGRMSAANPDVAP